MSERSEELLLSILQEIRIVSSKLNKPLSGVPLSGAAVKEFTTAWETGVYRRVFAFNYPTKVLEIELSKGSISEVVIGGERYWPSGHYQSPLMFPLSTVKPGTEIEVTFSSASTVRLKGLHVRD